MCFQRLSLALPSRARVATTINTMPYQRLTTIRLADFCKVVTTDRFALNPWNRTGKLRSNWLKSTLLTNAKFGTCLRATAFRHRIALGPQTVQQNRLMIPYLKTPYCRKTPYCLITPIVPTTTFFRMVLSLAYLREEQGSHTSTAALAN